MVHYELTDKRTGEIPSLNDVDKQICSLLGKTYSKQHFCYLGDTPEFADFLNWNNTIGLALAVGKTYGEIRQLWSNNQEVQIIVNYLESKYEVMNWRSLK